MTVFMTEAGSNLTIRGCAVDSGTLTADTEMVRLSHCGSFVLDTRCSTVQVQYSTVCITLCITVCIYSMECSAVQMS